MRPILAGGADSIQNILWRLQNGELDGVTPIVHVPYEKAYGASFSEIQHRQPSLDKLLRLTGMQFKWTLDTTLEDLIRRERERSEAVPPKSSVVHLKVREVSC